VRKSNRKGVPKPALAEVISLATFRSHPTTRKRRGRKCAGEVIQFRPRVASPAGLSALPLGIYELDRRGVVTYFNPARPPAPAVVGLDFFDAIAPGLNHLRDGYARFLLSDEPDYEAEASDRAFVFVKVMNSAVVIVDRL
jgi:hypothetical protein